MANILIRKAFYLCGTTREYLTDDIPKKCNCTEKFGDIELKHHLTRVVKFNTDRITIKGKNSIEKIIYPECGLKG